MWRRRPSQHTTHNNATRKVPPPLPQSGGGVALPIALHPTRSRCTCRFRCPPCLGGLEQRLKVLGTGVSRDLDDEALPRVVSLNLLEDPGEVKVGCKWGWVWGRGAVGGGGGSRGRVSEEARIGAKARWGLGFGWWSNRSSVSSWIMLSAAPGDTFYIAQARRGHERSL